MIDTWADDDDDGDVDDGKNAGHVWLNFTRDMWYLGPPLAV